MSTCLFLSFRFDTDPAAGETAKLDRLLRATPKLLKALVHTPASASDPYVKDGAPPALVLQLYFAEPPDLEAAVSRTGHLGALASHAEFPVLAAADIAQQAMIVRSFAVPDPQLKTPSSAPHCTYLVSYEGEADDLNAWHAHYLECHTAHMVAFPDIRELEVYTRLDWVSLQPWLRANFMQRNKVVFDSATALERALHSPVRHAMRADFNAFPKFSGPNRHYAMATRALYARGT
jgi:hypothetical protein